MTKEEYDTAHGLIQTLVEDDDSEQLGVIAKRLLRSVYEDGLRWKSVQTHQSKQEAAMNSAAHAHVHGSVG